MNEYRSFGTSVDRDYAPASMWAGFDEMPVLRPPMQRQAKPSSALPEAVITDEISENEQQRRTLSSILARFAAERQITRTSMHAAEAFIEALPRVKKLPKVAPDGEGGVLMAWERRQGRTLVTVADWMLYVVAKAGTPWAFYLDDMTFDENIPSDVLTVIPG